jgi:hypothetical protein
MFSSSIATTVPAGAARETSRPRRGQANSAASRTRADVVRRSRGLDVARRWTSGDVDLGVEYQAAERLGLLILGRLFDTVGEADDCGYVVSGLVLAITVGTSAPWPRNRRPLQTNRERRGAA